MTTILFIALLAALAADAGTTLYGIKRAGLKEANILPAKLMDRFGVVPVVVVAKGILAAAGAAALWLWPDDGQWFAGVVAAGHIGVTVWNVAKIRRAR